MSGPGQASARCRFRLAMKARKDTCKLDMTGANGVGVLEALWHIKEICLLLLLIFNVTFLLRLTMRAPDIYY